MNTMVQTNPDGLVMGTVNAPWKRELSAEHLATLIKTADLDDWLPHVATLFTEVRPILVLRYAAAHGITLDQLDQCLCLVQQRTGEPCDALRSALADEQCRQGGNATYSGFGTGHHSRPPDPARDLE